MKATCSKCGHENDVSISVEELAGMWKVAVDRAIAADREKRGEVKVGNETGA